MKTLEASALTAIQEIGIKNQTSSSDSKQLSVEALPTSLTLRNDEGGKTKLVSILGYCFNTLKVYGREPEQMEAAAKMFSFVLAEYPIEKISEAFRFYFKHNKEMPTPADIVNIIERGNRPAFDKGVYTALSMKKDYQRSFAEDQYVHEYEKFNLTGEI